MKVPSPHTFSDVPAVPDVTAFRQGLIERHTQQVDPIVESTDEEVYLPTVLNKR